MNFHMSFYRFYRALVKLRFVAQKRSWTAPLTDGMNGTTYSYEVDAGRDARGFWIVWMIVWMLVVLTLKTDVPKQM